MRQQPRKSLWRGRGLRGMNVDIALPTTSPFIEYKIADWDAQHPLLSQHPAVVGGAFPEMHSIADKDAAKKLRKQAGWNVRQQWPMPNMEGWKASVWVTDPKGKHPFRAAVYQDEQPHQLFTATGETVEEALYAAGWQVSLSGASNNTPTKQDLIEGRDQWLTQQGKGDLVEAYRPRQHEATLEGAMFAPRRGRPR